MAREYHSTDGVKGVTDTHVKGAVANEGDDGKAWYVWDTKIAGFGCKITPAGKKVFIFQYRSKANQPTRRITIGALGGFDIGGRPWTVDRATKEAQKLRGLVSSGVDPVKQARDKAADEAKLEAERIRQAELASELTVASRSATWLAHIQASKPKTYGFYRGIMNNYVVPKIGTIAMPDLTNPHIWQVIESIPANQPTLRRNAYATMSAFWRWTSRAYKKTTGLPLATYSPFSDDDRPEKPKARDRALSDDDIAIVWRAAGELAAPFGAFVHLLISTLQRRSEVAGIDWRELSRADREWMLPAHRSKNGEANIIHLGTLAVVTLDGLAGGPNWPKQGLVLTTNGKKSLGGFSYIKRLLEDAIADAVQEAELPLPKPWIIHDLRRTGATKLQKLGIRKEVTEAVLNHRAKSKSGIEGVYQLHDYAPEKVIALSALNTELKRILKIKVRPNVVPLRRDLAQANKRARKGMHM